MAGVAPHPDSVACRVKILTKILCLELKDDTLPRHVSRSKQSFIFWRPLILVNRLFPLILNEVSLSQRVALAGLLAGPSSSVRPAVSNPMSQRRLIMQ